MAPHDPARTPIVDMALRGYYNADQMLTPRARRAVLAALAIAVITAACGGPAVPLADQVEIVGVTTGWYDAGILEDGKNKLVPTISLQLRNAWTDAITTVQLNAVFRLVDDLEKEWGTAYARAISTEGLEPGASTPALVLQSQLGYTGDQPRHQMMQHSQFTDATVEVFGKRGSGQWEKLGEFPIDRQLLTK